MEIKKGQWYALCCHLDLEMAEEDMELEDDISWAGLWDSEKEALVSLLRDCAKEDTMDIQERINKIK